MAEKKTAQRYTEGKWGGEVLYKCSACPEAYTGDGGRELIERHYQSAHVDGGVGAELPVRRETREG